MTAEIQDTTADKRSKGERSEVARGAGVIAFFTLISRVTGLVRDQVIVHYFGATRVTDVFWIAFTIPNVLRRLVAEGALTIAFVPIYKGLAEEGKHKEAEDFYRSSVGLVAVGVLALTVICMLAAPALVYAFASGLAADPEAFALAVSLTRWLFPYVYFVSLVALAMGVLNAKNSYAAPAAAPIVLNIFWVSLTLLTLDKFENPIYALVVGVLAGGVAQVLLQVPALYSVKLMVSPRLDFSNPHIKTLLRRLVPQLFGLAVYQLNIVLLRQFASYMPDGQMTYYYNSDRLMQFAYGIFAVAISQAALPTMSAQSARGDYGALLKTWQYACRMTDYVVLPASLGLIALADPICSTLYFHGAFTAEDTRYVALTTIAFAPGLLGQGFVRATVQVFYAIGDTRTPVVASTVSVVSVVVLGFAAVFLGYDVVGLAGALSLASVVQSATLLFLLRRSIKTRAPQVPLGLRTVLFGMGAHAAIAVPAVGAAYAICRLGDWTQGPSAANGAILLGGIAASMVIYGALSVVFKLEELAPIVAKVKRKLARK